MKSNRLKNKLKIKDWKDLKVANTCNKSKLASIEILQLKVSFLSHTKPVLLM